MDEHTLALLEDLHNRNARQGPGSAAATRQALALSGLDTRTPLAIADIGCGSGASTLELAHACTHASISAVDMLPAFLNTLEHNAAAAGCKERISTVEADMAALPFEDEQFDVIWAEGAIYNIGFEKGMRDWRRFLKPGGVLVASEITWLRTDIPEELRAHWESEYPEIARASEKIAVLEQHGYLPMGYFVLPEECWLEGYYIPLEAGFADFLERHKNSEQARAIIEAERREIDLYKRFKDFVSYGVYIGRKVA